jgi:RNA polymerase sigma factor (sigma-70 family)
MQTQDDMALVREFAAHQSEAAFETLVARHVSLVYSAALRQTGQAHLAEEVTQAVFVILAQKAGRLRADTLLTGWLFQTTRYAAATERRARLRRQHYETEAQMESAMADTPEETAWTRIAPLLDEALAALGETDRRVVLLRYFENQTAAEVAATLKLKEAAAHKRLSRALEKLRRFFSKRGIALSAATLAGAVSAHAVQAAPAGLTATITATTVQGTLLSTTLTTLVNGTIKTMTWLKLKSAAGVAGVALLAGGAATVAISQTGGGTKPEAPAVVAKSRAAYAALTSYRDRGTVVAEISGQNVTTTFTMLLQRTNQYRIDWAQTAGSISSTGVVWSDGNGDHLQTVTPDFLMAAAGQKKNTDQPRKMPGLKQALASAAPLSASAATTLPALFFNQTVGDFTAPALSGRYPLKSEPDARVGDVDCYVVSSGMIDLSRVPDIGKPGTVATTLWIGKTDFLIHQSRTRYVEKADSTPTDQAIDEATNPPHPKPWPPCDPKWKSS